MNNYRKLLKFVRPYYARLFLSAVCMGMVTLFDVFRLSTIIPIIDRVFTNKPIVLAGRRFPLFIENILNYLNSLSPLKVLSLLLVIVPLALLMRAFFEFLHSYIMSDVGQRVIRDIRNLIYEKIQILSLDYYLNKKTGELVSRITNDVRLVENAVSYALTDLVYQSLELLAYIILIIFINWRMALICMSIPPLVVIPMLVVGKKLRKLSIRAQEKMADINSLLVETLIGVRIVRAFCMEKKEITKFKGQNQDYYKISMKTIKNTLILGSVSELIGVVAALFVIYYGGRKVILGELSFGVFTLFMAALLSLIRPIKKLSQVNSITQQALAATTRIYEVLDATVTVKEKPDAKELEVFKNNIVFEDVWFSYDHQSILKGINLEVKKGEILAIVGLSGVGKTTLVDLIPRFYDPQQGRILIDGIDIKELTLRSLRQQIGIVTQETILFNDTIKDNIAYGKPTASLEEIEEAAKKASAHDFIKNLPLGYQTIIGDRGMKLSGGERQRIAIARAILKNPAILILDEATSQLDSEAELIVKEALEKLMAGRTVFIIAHRISTVKDAHRIVVLDTGKIIEEGRHEELLKKDGLYKRLYQLQELQK